MRKELLMYCGMVAFLEQILGEDFAVALFDTDDLKTPVAASLNFAKAAEKLELNGKGKKGYREAISSACGLPFDYMCGFEGLREKIAADKTAFFFIKDDDENKIGVLVFIRLYTEKADIRQVVSVVLRAEPNAKAADRTTDGGREDRKTAGFGETSDSSRIDAEVNAIILETVQEIYEPYAGKKLKKTDKINMMRQFFEAGITRMRGGMNVICEVTGISLASLYRYLMEVIEE